MDWKFDKHKIEKVKNSLEEMNLVLFKHGIKVFNLNPMPKKNYCLGEELGMGFNVKPPRKDSKNYKETMIQLCTLKNYLTHFGDILQIIF